MADKKIVVRTLATELSLNTDSAKTGLKELTQAVKSANDEAKILEAQYKSSGDEVSASKAKYEGLSQVVDQQKTKVEALKQALEQNNTSTEAGRRNQEFLTAELAKAERQYQSYSGQLEKATASYKYQESGLADLSKELKHNNDLTKAHADALDAEGKHEEAQKVRLEGLKTAQANYGKQLAIQKDELKALADAGDKGSDSYKRQELRVAQMGLKLSETTRDIRNFNKEDIKPQTSGITTVKNQLESLDKALEGTRSQFKSVFLGNIVASGVTNAISSIKSHLTGALQAGVEYNKEMEKVKLGLSNFTNGDDKLSGQLLSNIKAIKESSGYATDTVTLLTKKTYGLTKNVDGALTLTDAFTNLGRATGKSDEAMGNLVTKFFQANASGKITTGSLTKLNKELPGFTDALGKNLGVSRDQLNKLATDGKLSMQQLGDAIQTMSDAKPLGLDNYYKSVDGFTNHFEERYKSLSGKLTEGFFSQSNNLLATFSKSLDGEAIDKAFGRIGDSANKAVNTVAKAFGEVFKGSKVNPLEAIANGTADAIDKLGKFVAGHAKEITEFFKSMKEIGATGFSTLGTALKIALPLLDELGKFASAHPKEFKLMAESIVGFNIALKGTLGVMAGFTKAKKAVTGYMDVGKKLGGLIIKPKVDGSDAKRELGVISKAVVATGKGMKSGLKATASVVTSKAKSTLTALQAMGKATGTALKKGLSVTASVATKGAQVALKALAVTGKATGLALKGAFTFLKANPLGLLITGIALAITALVELYKHNKKFRDFINGIIKSAVDMAKGIAQWFGDMWKTVSNIFGKIGDFIGDTLAWIKKAWDKYWQTMADFYGGIWKTLTSVGSSAIKGISSVIGDVLGGISSTWRSVWQGLSDFFGGIWKGIKGLASDGVNGVLGIVNSLIDSLDSVWKFFTGHETSIHHLKPVKFEQGGIVTQRLAMVNDGQGQNWKELIQTPDGQLMMSQKRNAVMPLPVGTRVYNGDETKEIMSSFGIEKYANGGIVGGAIDWAKGSLANVGDWIGDKFDAIGKFLDSPLSAIKSLISKATSHLIAPLGNFGQLASGMFEKLTSPIADWFTKGLKKVQEESQDAPPGTGVERWRDQVIRALQMNGLSTSRDMQDRVLRQIQTESGGNEKAIQGAIGDINNRTGNLARGLMQVIPPTFNANKFPGFDNPFRGLDSLLAGLNYAKKTYGPSLSFLGNGHGYANGGLITKHQIAEIGEGNKPEMIIPLDGMKSSRGFELLGKTAVAMASRDGLTGQGIADSQEVTQLLNQNNQLLGVVTQLLGAILGETEKGNQPVDPLALNTLSRTLLNRTVRSTN